MTTDTTEYSHEQEQQELNTAIEASKVTLRDGIHMLLLHLSQRPARKKKQWAHDLIAKVLMKSLTRNALDPIIKKANELGLKGFVYTMNPITETYNFVRPLNITSSINHLGGLSDEVKRVLSMASIGRALYLTQFSEAQLMTRVPELTEDELKAIIAELGFYGYELREEDEATMPES